MAVQKQGVGCGCCGLPPCGTPTSRTVNVKGCPDPPVGLVMSGITVNFVGVGGGSSSGVTDGSGNVTFSGLSADTYTRTAVAPDARFVNTSASAAVTCGTTATLPIAFTIAAGYTCGGAGGTACSPRPVKTTLFLTDPVLGAVTLSWSPSAWSGSLTVSRPNVRAAGCASPASRNILVQYGVGPVGPTVGGKFTQWQISISLDYCLSGGVKFLLVDSATPTGGDVVQGTSTAGGCPETGAVTVPVSFAGSPVNTFQSIWGSGTQNFTFSE